MISGQPIMAAAPAPEVEYLLSLDRPELLDLWRETFGSPPPKHLSALFVQRAIAYEIQCRMTHPVPERVQKALRAIASGKRVAAASARSLRPGTCLIAAARHLPDAGMEWTDLPRRGDGGWRLFDGRQDLPVALGIAKRITGSHWSGPRFFGIGR